MDVLKLPCGGTAFFDYESGCSYRCSTCYAVIGSIGQSKECKDAAQMYANWEALGGAGWCYVSGKPAVLPENLDGTEYTFNPDDYPV
jgi:hypothetical protein